MTQRSRPSHAELFVSVASRQTIGVRCDCPKKRDHYYERPVEVSPTEPALAARPDRNADTGSRSVDFRRSLTHLP